ncbi:MAG: hypothetical protein ABIR32_05495 [Ilumatobacteraceae bacterium]
MRRLLVLLTSASLIAAGCSGGDDGTSGNTAPPASADSVDTGSTVTGSKETQSTEPADTDLIGTAPTETGPPSTELAAPQPATEGACSTLDERSCMLPWPNNEYTIIDDSTATGRRLSLPANGGAMNVDGVSVDFADQNRADGFSPGSAVLAFIPDVDLERSGVANSLDIGSSLDEDAPILLVNTQTGERHPYWAELDAQAPVGQQLLEIHPAIAFTEGVTYSVRLDGLVDADGEPVSATLPMEWSFTIASAESLSSRLLHIRAEAYAQLGGASPSFTIGDVVDSGGVRTIDGTFDVPNFLTGDGGPGNHFLLGVDGLPVQSTDAPIYPARFRCVLGTGGAHPVVLYGHGLLGSRNEVDFFAGTAQLLAGCATDWIGMSSEDIPTVIEILGDQSRFNEQADRLQQAHLAFQLLGILVNQPDGFASDPAFHADDGAPLITNKNTTFLGNSQGGILGGATTAISTEWSRAVLGVPAMNYSLLLTRSSDWPQFQGVFDVAYPDPVDRVLALQTSQLLWDRGENQGYAQHLTSEPYAGFSGKPVVLIGAFGDHQVSNVATDVFARTIRVGIHRPALRDGRTKQINPYWGIKALEATSTDNGGYVMWDYGTAESPPVNLPPSEAEHGRDPHGAGSNEPGVLTQVLGFLLTGTLDISCDGPCIGRQIDDT